jgi:hypothetical protein
MARLVEQGARKNVPADRRLGLRNGVLYFGARIGGARQQGEAGGVQVRAHGQSGYREGMGWCVLYSLGFAKGIFPSEMHPQTSPFKVL